MYIYPHPTYLTCQQAGFMLTFIRYQGGLSHPCQCAWKLLTELARKVYSMHESSTSVIKKSRLDGHHYGYNESHWQERNILLL